ncbi:MAG: hypothetical protein QM708_07420 [Propioniciclava sp.]|uniref:tetratricopeptide repeat protein n=1 Tax=Propioniciclava sp. TaxID=2038686 RepID=UPI0039E3DE78
MTRAHDDDGTYADVEALDGTPAEPRPTTSAAPAASPAGKASTTPRRRRPRTLFVLVALAFGIGIIFSVWQMGQPSSAALPPGHPSLEGMTQPTATARPLDEASVAAWKAKVEQNPKDAESLRAIAHEYYRVGEYAESARWQAKLVELNPDDVDNLLILGVALYSGSDFAEAEKVWLKTAVLAPTSAEPWYNLGFLYLSLDPPDDQRAEAAWQRVIDIDPSSDMAITVGKHLSALDSGVPGSTPSPTPSR